MIAKTPTTVGLSPVLRAHLGAAVRAHIRQLSRDGVLPPPELLALVEELRNDPERYAADRKRALGAARSRRYRARRRETPTTDGLSRIA